MLYFAGPEKGISKNEDFITKVPENTMKKIERNNLMSLK